MTGSNITDTDRKSDSPEPFASRVVKSRHTKRVDFIIACVCLLLIIVCLTPMLNIFARSLSSSQALINRRVFLWPVDFTWESYQFVFKDASFSRSMIWTAFLTVVCTIVSMIMTVLCAYPLTYGNLKGRQVINTAIILTMYFSAGTIPNYILMRDLKLLNNPLVLILPGCLSVFNMIVLRSFFYSIPESLRESAELDGANPLVILVRIFLPLSTSVLATLALFYAVGRWNGFSDALLYMTTPKYAPIQLKLYQIINNLSAIETAQNEGIAAAPMASEGLKAASVMFATLPILLVYPWLQKYFIAGVTIGAVKG
ncbi:MAG: carbohydrate ABC transporter permease [Oscillospiraceae bacterium]|jgi:putative aldouronate transport system permease protein|nr:carbohydrate ABC transporter permease [Oscillospiraceae bacterium]